MSNSDYKIKKVELNSSGVVALLQSNEVMNELEKVAVSQIGEIESSYVGFDRCHVIAKEN